MVFDKGSQPKALCTLSCKYSKDEQEKKGTDSSFFFEVSGEFAIYDQQQF